MRLLKIAAPAVATLAAVTAFAQAPAGPEFRVSTYTFDIQWDVDVAALADGGYVVVWTTPDQGISTGVGGQRYDARGAAIGGEFRVNDATGDLTWTPRVAVDAGGAFTVVWRELRYGSGAGYDVRGRRYDASGVPRGPSFVVNAYTTGHQYQPDIVSRADGSFVVVWTAVGQDGSGEAIVGQRFDPGGAPLGGAFQVNSYIGGRQNAPSVAMDGAGNFVVVWTSWVQEAGGRGIFGQRFTAAGDGQGSEFRVGAQPSGTKLYASVAAAPDGRFVVVWDDIGLSLDQVFGRRFDAAGVPQGGDFLVYSNTGYVSRVQVASDGAGRFVVAWTDLDGDASGSAVLARRYEADSARRGGVFRVNATVTGGQVWASIAAAPGGELLAAWQSTQDELPTSYTNIYGQRYGRMEARALAVDTLPAASDGNGVLEPGETVDVRPSWRNNTGLGQPLAGTLGPLNGPPGAVYSTVDAAGSYGTIPDAAVGACIDCYGVAVSAPALRPAAHWDAVARESLALTDDEAHADWTLHVGDSFADVPRASPYYRYLETLLHHQVLGACAGGGGCPDAGATREDMAAFVLRAHEGAWFFPPACVTSRFSDVPAASPSCRWIEELARRGVVGGCGQGRFCPQGAVTREQTAVFVLRTLDPALEPPPCATPMFGDVPASSPFCRWIEELARRGVVGGCGGGNYCPSAVITRGQLAVVISATFGLVLYGP